MSVATQGRVMVLRVLLIILINLFLTVPSFAQDALTAIRQLDAKNWNPKSKGLTDLVVEISNPSITKQLNDQLIFGRLEEVKFKVYWTANPERVAVEVLGMPEGFKEIKEELKMLVVGRMEAIIPISLEKKLTGYDFRSQAGVPNTYIATDSKHIQPIPEFVLKYSADGKLNELIAKKPIGTMKTSFVYSQEAWSAQKWVTKKMIAQAEDGPQSTEIITEIDYVPLQGLGLPSVVRTKTKQVLRQAGQEGKNYERQIEETIFYKNYQINTGQGMKWFLGQSAP